MDFKIPTYGNDHGNDDDFLPSWTCVEQRKAVVRIVKLAIEVK